MTVHVFYGSADRLPAATGIEAADATLRGSDGFIVEFDPAGDVDGDGRADSSWSPAT